MTRARRVNAVALVLVAACGGKLEAAPERTVKLDPIADLCVTRGAARPGTRIDQPTVRAVAPGTHGDAAALAFTFRGATTRIRELASGEARRQLGLKLRAANGCNLVYVMWRLDPRPEIEVSVKLNPGMTTHRECGAEGYTKVRATVHGALPALADGGDHTLRAAISGDDLTAWVDDRVVWRGALPVAARALFGPAGLRSDNLAYDLVSFSAAPGSTERACRTETTD